MAYDQHAQDLIIALNEKIDALRAENARLLDLIGRLANTIEFLNSTHNAGEGEDIVAEARKAMGESDDKC